MFFFPYRVDLDLPRLPWVTILVCVLCIVVYALQSLSQLEVNKSATKFCAHSVGGSFSFVLKRISPQENELDSCVRIISGIHSTSRPDRVILNISERAEVISVLERNTNISFLAKSLSDLYAIYEENAPRSLTAILMYDPQSFNVFKMISSAFSHAGWLHLLGNLFFFFAFAAAVEIFIGTVRYLGLIVLLAILTNLTYSLVMWSNASALPTVGLSGVVMGMIGVFIVLIPTVRIRCFVWLIVILRFFTLPAWILAFWCLAWDVLQLYYDSGQSGINFVAHISGAIFGVTSALLLFQKFRPPLRG